MNYKTRDDIIHAEVPPRPTSRQRDGVRYVYLACGGMLVEEAHVPPWLYKRETRAAPTCVKCMVRLLGGLGR